MHSEGAACRRPPLVASLVFAAVLLALIGVVVADWTNILVLPLVLVPPAAIAYVVYFRWLRKIQNQDDMCLRMFGLAFAPGALLAMLVEMVTSIIFVLILLRKQIKAFLQRISAPDAYSPDDPEDTGSDASVVAFLFLTAFVTAATVEEVMKVMIVRCTCGPAAGACGCVQQRQSYTSPRHLTYATTALLIATALGFSFVENLLYVFGSSLSGKVVPSLDTVGVKCMLAVVRGCVSMPIHCLCVAFSALRLTLRDAQRGRREFLAAAAARSGVYRWSGPAESGPTAQVMTTCPNTAPRPSALGEWVLMQDAATAAKEAEAVRVWSWPRVLWPAIVVHGVFDFQAMLLGALLSSAMSELSLTILTLALGVVVLVVALWVLRQQYRGVFERIANNDVPSGLTLGVHWLLCGVPSTVQPPVLPDVGSNAAAAVIPLDSGAVEDVASALAPHMPSRQEHGNDEETAPLASA